MRRWSARGWSMASREGAWLTRGSAEAAEEGAQRPSVRARCAVGAASILRTPSRLKPWPAPHHCSPLRRDDRSERTSQSTEKRG